MKYNKSQIMKEAWAYHKKFSGYTFSHCLRRAWKLAKEAAQEANKIPFVKEATMEYDFHEVSFRLWENYGKRRIYCSYGHGGSYIDLNNGNKIVAGGKAAECLAQFLRFYQI